MRANGFNVGGEQSGHIVLSDYNTTGDGLIAAIEVLCALEDTGNSVSELGGFSTVPSNPRKRKV